MLLLSHKQDLKKVHCHQKKTLDTFLRGTNKKHSQRTDKYILQGADIFPIVQKKFVLLEWIRSLSGLKDEPPSGKLMEKLNEIGLCNKTVKSFLHCFKFWHTSGLSHNSRIGFEWLSEQWFLSPMTHISFGSIMKFCVMKIRKEIPEGALYLLEIFTKRTSW